MPLHQNVRRCTHIQITGHRCGSPALKGEFFCYFHTRMIKGVQTRVDSQINPIALITPPHRQEIREASSPGIAKR